MYWSNRVVRVVQRTDKSKMHGGYEEFRRGVSMSIAVAMVEQDGGVCRRGTALFVVPHMEEHLDESLF